MRALRQKAGSQRGASITFALLLFLVCAVISSVVIVAATAAAGRMSEQSEMDERYYAVTAIARQLEKRIEKEVDEITLEYNKTNKTVTGITPATIKQSDILAKASVGVLTNALKLPSERAQIIVYDNSNAGSTPITNSDNSVECTIKGTLGIDGTLVFDIIATTKETATKKSRSYALKLTFASDLKITASDSSQATGKATIKWKLLGAEKVRNDRKQTTGG